MRCVSVSPWGTLYLAYLWPLTALSLFCTIQKRSPRFFLLLHEGTKKDSFIGLLLINDSYEMATLLLKGNVW